MKKYIKIVAVIYLGFIQGFVQAKENQRSEPAQRHVFKKTLAILGVLPGAAIGASLGYLWAGKMVSMITCELVKSPARKRIALSELPQDSLAALGAINIGLLTGFVQGGIYGGYAGLLLGAGYGVQLDRKVYELSTYLPKVKGHLWVDNQDRKS